MAEKHTCCGRKHGGLVGITCRHKAAYEYEGRWYCKTHHPPTMQAKRDARDAEWKAQFDARRRERERVSKLDALKDRALKLCVDVAVTGATGEQWDRIRAIAAEYKELTK